MLILKSINHCEYIMNISMYMRMMMMMVMIVVMMFVIVVIIVVMMFVVVVIIMVVMFVVVVIIVVMMFVIVVIIVVMMFVIVVIIMVMHMAFIIFRLIWYQHIKIAGINTTLAASAGSAPRSNNAPTVISPLIPEKHSRYKTFLLILQIPLSLYLNYNRLLKINFSGRHCFIYMILPPNPRLSYSGL